MSLIWKDIDGLEGKFQISNSGLIKSLKRPGVRNDRILKTVLDKDGYVKITLGLGFKGGRTTRIVSRMVAEAFIANPKNLPEVNHKDGNKQNNNDWNLEWSGRQDNVTHFRRKLQNKKRGVSWSKKDQNWYVRLSVDGKQKRIGPVFYDKEEAYQYFYASYLEVNGVAPWSKNEVP